MSVETGEPFKTSSGGLAAGPGPWGLGKSALSDGPRTFPPGVPIVSMIEFGGRIYVATSHNVYVIVGEKLVLLKLEVVDPLK